MLQTALSRRLVLIALALLGGLVAMSFSLAMATARPSPGQAMRLAPYLSEPRARLADTLLPAAVETGDTGAIAQLAREAALRDPLNPDPVRTLGFLERTDGRDETANTLFAYANALTRRDIGTNLDFVMEAAKHGDAETMIRHFSIALRTNRGSWDRLFPIIYQASASDEIAAPLARVLATDPQWKWSFLDGLVRQGPEPLVTANLFARLERTEPLNNDELYRTLISRLLADGHYDEALARHRWMVERKGFTSLSNGGFDREPLGTAFEWTAGVNSVLETAVADNVTSNGFGRSLYFRVPTGADGELARVTALLFGQRQELSVMIGAPLQGEAGDLIFEVECLGSGAVVERRVLSRPPAGRLRIAFSAPDDCPAARLYLKARTRTADSTWASWIDEIELAESNTSRTAES